MLLRFFFFVLLLLLLTLPRAFKMNISVQEYDCGSIDSDVNSFKSKRFKILKKKRR